MTPATRCTQGRSPRPAGAAPLVRVVSDATANRRGRDRELDQVLPSVAELTGPLPSVWCLSTLSRRYCAKLLDMTSHEAREALGAAIRRRRLALGLTQVEFGRRVGYLTGAGVSISRIENGGTWPQTDKLTRIASALGTDVTTLLADAGLRLATDTTPGARPLKEQRHDVEARYLNRSTTLSRAATAYFTATERAVTDLVTPFLALTDQLATSPPDLAALTPRNAGDLATALAPDSTVALAGVEIPGASGLGAAWGAGGLDAAGRGAAAGVFALVRQFGTASTGAPIRNLHGIAQWSAAMARIGGGPVALNGRGITGGLAVLDVVAQLPKVIAVGGVFALAMVSNRREQREKIAAAYRFLDQTQERFDAVMEHLTRSTQILETATTHGGWAFESWREVLDPRSGGAQPTWADLDTTQRERHGDLMQVITGVITLLALPPEDLLTAPSQTHPPISELAYGHQPRPASHPDDPQQLDASLQTFEELRDWYRDVRDTTHTVVRSALGRRA